jgi:iron-sulfur cluster repair protein YtfE (RIC family)
VLRAKGINHCCGAHLTLREAAAAAGTPLDDLLESLDSLEEKPA